MIEDILAPFSLGRLQELVVVYETLKQNNISIDDFVAHIKTSTKRAKRLINKKTYRGLSCPVCDSPLLYHNIDLPLGNKNLYGWRGVWSCSSASCTFEKFLK